MKTLKIRFIRSTGCFMSNDDRARMPDQQILQYFFPSYFNYQIVNQNEEADICLFSIQLSDKNLLRDNEVNILVCIENCNHFSHYKHQHLYGNFGNDKIDIFMYNHFDKLFYHQTKLIVPTLYSRINYYQQIKEEITLSQVPFKDKKFCLMINKSGLNPDIYKFSHLLSTIDKVDSIFQFDLGNSSCYNSKEILNLFSNYKFIICFENSREDGYITEKIFNCFLANTIPIYWGSKIANKFFDEQGFIFVKDLPTFDFSLIKELNQNEEKYLKILNFKDKIRQDFDNQEYQNEMIKVIKYKLKL